MRRALLAVTVVCRGAQALHAGQSVAPSDRLDLDLCLEHEVVSDLQIDDAKNRLLVRGSEMSEISPEQVVPPAPLRLRPSPRG